MCVYDTGARKKKTLLIIIFNGNRYTLILAFMASNNIHRFSMRHSERQRWLTYKYICGIINEVLN